MISRLARVPALCLLLLALVAAHPFMAGAAKGAVGSAGVRIEAVVAASSVSSAPSGHRACLGKVCLDAVASPAASGPAAPRVGNIFHGHGVSLGEEIARLADTPPPRHRGV